MNLPDKPSSTQEEEVTTSSFDDLTDPATPGPSLLPTSTQPQIPLAAILSVVVASYLAIVLVVIVIRSYIARRGLVAECCGVADYDSTCEYVASDMAYCCQQCCECSFRLPEVCVEFGEHSAHEISLFCERCTWCFRDSSKCCSGSICQRCEGAEENGGLCCLPSCSSCTPLQCACSKIDYSSLLTFNCNCSDRNCGRFDCLCLQFKIKRFSNDTGTEDVRASRRSSKESVYSIPTQQIIVSEKNPLS